VFLLLERDELLVFDLRQIAETLLWNAADLTRVQILEPVKDGYRERLVFGADGAVSRIERRYKAERRVGGQALLAQRRRQAEIWAASDSASEAIAAMRGTRRFRIDTIDCSGRMFGAASDDERDACIRTIAASWAHPERVIEGIRPLANGIFGLEGDTLATGDRCVGPVWLGARRSGGERSDAIGPAVVWDDAPRQPVRVRAISEIFSPEYARSSRERDAQTDWYDPLKRMIDFTAAAIGLVVLAPLIAFIAVAIALDDGFPVFFGHRRQSRGGRVFRCWKFRTMRRNAEALVAELRKQNLCDGPQVFIRNDPRVTRVGRLLRKTQLDELPQLWNVLRGDMSLVGPRPSPENENQFCPAWREKRLSVRPGITGLWQVMRTRAPGKDFQEWIQFDIEYVDGKSPWLDIRILWLTLVGMVRRGK
jgi:lipopolysaccharide/colanic/teichoic acid biosynthesis glycosyltransferase